MNHATEKSALEHLRRRLEEACDRQAMEEALAYSRQIDRLTAEHLRRSARV